MTTSRQDKINQVLSNRQEGVVVFEDIHDPHNAAAVLRSCDAFGFQKAYYIFEKEKYYNPKKIGKASSTSANKLLSIETFRDTKSCYEKLKAEGFTIYATTLNPNNPVNLYEKFPTLGPKIAIVFGNEFTGISEYGANHADYHLYIPMRGFVQSFNISVCAALVLGEITRKRVEEGIDKYQLPAIEKENLRSSWK
ncbi:MAG: RNA methyltransferase [Patescibacteria group bacterium]